MTRVNTSLGQTNRIDDALYDAATATPGQPIRLRVQPQIFTRRPGRPRAAMYLGWKGVYWNLECASTREAIQFREALARFFRLLARHGAEETLALFDRWLTTVPSTGAPTARTVPPADT